MMLWRIFCFSFFPILAYHSFAQDEIPTYHNKFETFLKIKEPDIRADLAAFTLGGLDESMGKEPLPSLPVTGYGDNYVEFSNDNVYVKVTSAKFDPSKHKLQYYDQYVVRIDRKPFYGVDGQMPKKTIDTIEMMIGNDTVQIPKTAYFDLYEPRFCSADASSGKVTCNTRVYVSNDKRKIYIYMLNSSGRGGYEVTWVIEDKKYLRRVVDFDF